MSDDLAFEICDDVQREERGRKTRLIAAAVVATAENTKVVKVGLPEGVGHLQTTSWARDLVSAIRVYANKRGIAVRSRRVSDGLLLWGFVPRDTKGSAK